MIIEEKELIKIIDSIKFSNELEDFESLSWYGKKIEEYASNFYLKKLREKGKCNDG